MKKSRGILILLGIGLTACGGQPQAGAPPSSAVGVKVASLTEATLNDSSEYVATLESRRSVTLQPRVEGQISKILVKAGERVAAGSLLLQIDPARQEATVRSTEAGTGLNQADLENSRQTLRALQANQRATSASLALEEADYQRYSALAQEGAVSKQTLDQATNRRAAARANLDAIKAQIAAQRASVTRAQKSLQQAQANNSQEQVQLDFYRVTAPFAGVVGDIPVKVGDYITPSSLLLSLTENNALELNIAVPMEQANRLRIGLPVQLLDPNGLLLATSKIFFVSPTVNTQSQSILVKAKFDNPQSQLRADQLLRARIVWQQRPGFLIPTAAVARVAGLDFVYVAHPGKEKKLVAQQREVQLGEIQGNNYQVLSGLKPQEQVVVSGILKLADGTPIVLEQ